MKKIVQSRIFLIVMCGIFFTSVGVYAATIYQANDISYSPTDSSWEVNNVGDAINSLYNNVVELENIKTIGDATAAQILSGKKAVVKGSTVTGTMTNRGTWTSTPTSSGKVTIPAGYHSGSGYVDTATVYTNGYNAGAVASTASVLFFNNGAQYTAVGQEKTIDLKSYSNYKNLVLNKNLFLVLANGSTLASHYAYERTGVISNLGYSYDAATGILTYSIKLNGTTLSMNYYNDVQFKLLIIE